MDYHINIFFSEEAKGYIADIPDFSGCSAYGDTPEKALQELTKEAWLATAREKNIAVPPPKYRPAIYQIPS
jgi:predicted RNase H-like HicB family nuclease